MPGDPGRAYASMGNYLFEPEALVQLLEQTVRGGGTDFGKHMLPSLPAIGCRALAYDFSGNEVPGLQPYEARAYWRDVGTLDALAKARNDTQGPAPRFDLRNPCWPIRRSVAGPVPERFQPRCSGPFSPASLPGRPFYGPATRQLLPAA